MKRKFVGIVLLLALTGCTPQAQDISVKTIQAASGELQSNVEVAGVLLPSKTENVSGKLSGQVKVINAEVGQQVKKGDVLIELDAKELDAQLKQAQAGLSAVKDQIVLAKVNMDAAKSSLDTTDTTISDQVKLAEVNMNAAKAALDTTQASIKDQVSMSKINLDSAEALLESTKAQNTLQMYQAKLNMDTTQDSYNKVSVLFNAGTVSQQEMDKADNALKLAKSQYEVAATSTQTALLSATSKLDSAKSQYEQAIGSSGQSQLLAAQAKYEAALSTFNQTKGSQAKNQKIAAQSKFDVAKQQFDSASSSTMAQTQASVDTIAVQLSNAIIQSPIDGTVVNKNIGSGEIAPAGATLLTVADLNLLKINTTISQEVLPYVKVGQEIDVVVDIYPDQVLKGKISNIAPISVNTGSYFPIEIEVVNSENKISAGLSAHATIAVKSEQRILVPVSALIENNGQNYVFVVENGIAKKREVLTGLRNAEQVEILKGMTQSDQVVVTHANTLFDNMPVILEN